MVRLTRRYRSQTLIAHELLALGLFMGLPVEKPALWVMDVWGDVHVPILFWPVILWGVALGLLLTRSPAVAQRLMMTAFVLLGTVAGAAWLSQGANGFTVMSLVLMLHAAWTSVDLKGLAEYKPASDSEDKL